MGTTDPVLIRAIEMRRTIAEQLAAVRENTDLILDAVTTPGPPLDPLEEPDA